jgi:hypothetical protein
MQNVGSEGHEKRKKLRKNVNAAGLVESYMRELGIDPRIVLMLRINPLHNLSLKYSFKAGYGEQRIHVPNFIVTLQRRLLSYFSSFTSSLYFGYLVKLALSNIVKEFNIVLQFLYCLGYIKIKYRDD